MSTLESKSPCKCGKKDCPGPVLVPPPGMVPLDEDSQHPDIKPASLRQGPVHPALEEMEK